MKPTSLAVYSMHFTLDGYFRQSFSTFVEIKINGGVESLGQHRELADIHLEVVNVVCAWIDGAVGWHIAADHQFPVEWEVLFDEKAQVGVNLVLVFGMRQIG